MYGAAPEGTASRLLSPVVNESSLRMDSDLRDCQLHAFPQLKSNRRPGQPSKRNLTEAIRQMRSWQTGGVVVKVEDRYQLAGRFRRRYLAASKNHKGQVVS